MNTKTWTNLSLLQKVLVFAFRTCGFGAIVSSSHLGVFFFLAVKLSEHVNGLWTSFCINSWESGWHSPCPPGNVGFMSTGSKTATETGF